LHPTTVATLRRRPPKAGELLGQILVPEWGQVQLRPIAAG